MSSVPHFDPTSGNPESPPATGVDLQHHLEAFGFDAFRPGQREAIQTLLHVGRLLLVAPTGGGKSLIYQLPATFLPGTTLVISPLISLMNDQVTALQARGVPATFLASTIDGDELRDRMQRMGRGEYKIVYAAPERLAFPGFRSLVRDLSCPLIAIDEAHCISEWGHDFRPEYLQIGELLAEVPPTRVLACTATATPIVRDEILARLGFGADTPQMVHGFARPNLSLRAREVGGKRDRELWVDITLEESLGRPGAANGVAIIYAPTRKGTEAESERLAQRGWRCRAYHAGLTGEVRDAVHSAFMSGELDVVVATNAFGMGIDRPDVRTVLHLAPPGSIESYYQEVGRAGRDGADAIGLLMFAPGDMPLRRRLLESDIGGRRPDPEVIQHKWNLFLELMRWAEGGSCRHDAILRYFGDEEETLAGCGRCDVCVDLAGGGGSDGAGSAASSEDVSVIVRKALSAVARLKGRFGLRVAAALLEGTRDERLEWSGLDKTKTFGALGDRSEEWLVRLLRRCVTAGWVDFKSGDRPLAILTEEGRAVLFGEHPVRLLLPPTQPPERPRARGRSAVAGTAADRATGGRLYSRPPGAAEDDLDAAGRELFEALRAYRLRLAQAQSVPPYVIASDRSLRDIAHLRPTSLGGLQLAHGIGPAKAQRYGKAMLEIIAAHTSEDPGSANHTETSRRT